VTAGWLPAAPDALFGAGATAAEAYDVLTVDVPPGAWVAALTTARDELGCTFFDWLSAVDEPGTGLRVCAHVVALGAPPRRLLLRTTLPRDGAALPTATGVYAGAAWHERETHEMFGVDFPGHPGLTPLLLPDAFEGHPLRKDFVLAARVVKAWPGAKDPGGPAGGGRRPVLPPGVPDPRVWGPEATGAGEAEAADAAPAGAEPRRPRRARSASEGSASQGGEAADGPARPRRSRSASEGSASQRGEAADGPARPRRSRSASDGSASQRRTPDAPWHQPAAPDDAPGEGGDA
jgi:NADH:ubiquinone oxidoreductase subunit C